MNISIKDLDLALKAVNLAEQGKFDMAISLLIFAGFGSGSVCERLKLAKAR